jgi:hypothetical protein
LIAIIIGRAAKTMESALYSMTMAHSPAGNVHSLEDKEIFDY